MTSGNTPNETPASLQAGLREQATRTVIFHSAVAARLGITVVDLSCLNVLSLDGPQTPGRLADRLGITRGGAVTAMIDRLERAGYVRRMRDPADRRRVQVVLDPNQAEARVAPLFAGLGASLGGDLASFGDAEIEVLSRFVATLGERVRQATDDLRSTPTS
ncbi:MarR family winged helix-turn-helix transcriptional regulator [Nocardia lijiangensis]|uniref:MarR family winged helix-turn-helix transcriptional regulator n=1 Tax=Nocardia lijiangensis TaxID=299618 RepID=UPI00082B1F7A|nr:MarR family transcriptional regulator [Nocardia lijiangensis]